MSVVSFIWSCQVEKIFLAVSAQPAKAAHSFCVLFIFHYAKKVT